MDTRDRAAVHALRAFFAVLAIVGCRPDAEPIPEGDPPPSDADQVAPPVSPPVPRPTLAGCPCDRGEAPLVFRRHAERATKIWWALDHQDEWCALVGLAGVESHWRHDAVSPVGARNAYQVMPGTWIEHIAQMGLEGSPFDPWLSAQVAARHLERSEVFWFAPRSRMCKWGLKIASYNAGEGNIEKGQRLSGGEPCWSGIKPVMPEVTGHHATETINHVARWHRVTSRQCGYELPAREL